MALCELTLAELRDDLRRDDWDLVTLNYARTDARVQVNFFKRDLIDGGHFHVWVYAQPSEVESAEGRQGIRQRAFFYLNR